MEEVTREEQRVLRQRNGYLREVEEMKLFQLLSRPHEKMDEVIIHENLAQLRRVRSLM